MDKTDKLLKQLKVCPQVMPIARDSGGNDFILPNNSGVKDKVEIQGGFWTGDGTNVYLKTSAGTTILTINLTTGNITLGGTQKRVICTKVVGA